MTGSMKKNPPLFTFQNGSYAKNNQQRPDRRLRTAQGSESSVGKAPFRKVHTLKKRGFIWLHLCEQPWGNHSQKKLSITIALIFALIQLFYCHQLVRTQKA